MAKPKRDHKAAYRRRDERARALGFRNYYDQRVRGGRLEAPRPKGETLRRARGHAGPKDLESVLRSGRVAILSQEPIGERGADGRYKEVRVTAQMTDGSQRRFRLRTSSPTGDQLSSQKLRALRQAIVDSGTDVYTNPSLDVLTLSGAGADEDLDYVEEAA